MLAQQISQLPGVAQVLVYGSQKFAVRVQVDPVAAAARNISLDDIRTVARQGQLQHAGRHSVRARARTSRCWRPARCGKRVGLQERRRGLAQRRAGQARRNRQRHRQRRERQGRELVQRRPRRRAGDPAPARRQHRRGRRRGAGRKLPQFRAQVPAVDPHGDADRPLDLDPRTRSHDVQETLADRLRARHPGDLPVPALGLGDHHSRRWRCRSR